MIQGEISLDKDREIDVFGSVPRFSVRAREEGLNQAIDAGGPPAESPLGRTAHHSISLNGSARGCWRPAEAEAVEVHPKRRALCWHHVIGAIPKSTLQWKTNPTLQWKQPPAPLSPLSDCSHQSRPFLTQLALCLSLLLHLGDKEWPSYFPASSTPLANKAFQVVSQYQRKEG